MRVLRYPTRALAADYARAGAGLLLTLGPLAMIDDRSVAIWVLGPLAALFAAFGLRTLARQLARIELSSESIALLAPSKTRIDWGKMRAVKLSFYSTKADRQGGWMQLTLKGPSGPGGGTIRIDSTLEDFADVARAAAEAATARGVAVSPASRANFAALGVRLPGGPAPEAAPGP